MGIHTSGRELHEKAHAGIAAAEAARIEAEDHAMRTGEAPPDAVQRRLFEVRAAGVERGRAHNQELHELGHIRRHGGYQWDLPLRS